MAIDLTGMKRGYIPARIMDVKDNQAKVPKHFWCSGCRRYWHSADYVRPEETGIDLPEGEADDRYNWYAVCPGCGEWIRANRHYYANLGKMHAAQTGPRTAEGKRRSALNGMKHGLNARPQHMLAPANGKYDICRDCESADECKAGTLKYCPYKTDLLARFMAAYENGEVKDMKPFAGLTQGRLYMILEMMLAEVMEKGVLLKSPLVSGGTVVEYTDKDGNLQRIDQYSANPLIALLGKVMSDLGMTSDQQVMNPAKADGTDDMDGSLKVEKTDVHTFMNDLKDLMNIVTGGAAEVAASMRNRDPVAQGIEEDTPEDGEVPEPDEIDNPFR